MKDGLDLVRRVHTENVDIRVHETELELLKMNGIFQVWGTVLALASIVRPNILYFTNINDGIASNHSFLFYRPLLERWQDVFVSTGTARGMYTSFQNIEQRNKWLSRCSQFPVYCI